MGEIDWDALLEYKTLKVVVIQDKRLGLFHYGFMVLILIYVIAYTVVVKQGYLLTEPPFGSARATLQQPSILDEPDKLSYCAQNQPYSTLSDGVTLQNSDCIYLAGYDIEYPSGIRGYTFGTTRIKDIVYTIDPQCNILPTSPSCLSVSNTSTTRAYTANIENFTLYLEHSVYGAQTGVIRQNTECWANLVRRPPVKHENNTIVELPLGRAADIFPVWQLMKAAGIDTLEHRSAVTGTVNGSLRYDGALFVVVIDYTNQILKPTVYNYTYSVVYIPGLEAVAFEPSRQVSANQRYQRTRHGVSFVYLITGKIGKFDFATLLATLISGAVLTNVSGVLVDLLLTYVLPQRGAYKPRKYDHVESGKKGAEYEINEQ